MSSRREWLAHAGLGVLGAACGDDGEAPADLGADVDTGSDAGVRDSGADTGADTGVPMDAGPAPVPTVPFGFGFGVASGDPTSDSVILWTRYLPESGAEQELAWELATSPDFGTVVDSGTVRVSAVRDFTAKVDATGLDAGTTYYYRFSQGGEQSLVGRAKTASASAENVRLGVVSCSNYARGYFHVYRQLAERTDLDAVLHLGDYIYEYGTRSQDLRESDPPEEILDLQAYRRRYQLYRMDPDLQALHQQQTVVAVWDDHESANDAWRDGAENHDGAEGPWASRKAAAIQSYFEWMPIREIEPGRVWRRFDFGGLVRLLMLDTRLWDRDEQGTLETRNDDGRSLLGEDQESWLREQLDADGPMWRVLGQQVMVGQWLTPGDREPFTPVNLDQWDGYGGARGRLFDAFASTENVVVLTGDVHSHWAMELTPEPHDAGSYDAETSRGSLGVEFVASAVTSEGAEGLLAEIGQDLALSSNPHLRYVNLAQRGYVILDVDSARAQADFWVLDGIGPAEGEASVDRSFFVQAGSTRLEETMMPIAAREGDAAAPGIPARGHLPGG